MSGILFALELNWRQVSGAVWHWRSLAFTPPDFKNRHHLTKEAIPSTPKVQVGSALVSM